MNLRFASPILGTLHILTQNIIFVVDAVTALNYLPALLLSVITIILLSLFQK